MKAVIYHAFSHKEAEEHYVQELGSQRPGAFVRAFLKQSMPHWSQQDCESHLQSKAVVWNTSLVRSQSNSRRNPKASLPNRGET
ncbi:ribonuclease P protein subunit p29-like [Peromyscus maniculatus bairdii]|uniref:ribonuclease P protein subunit p29-like n=1 Tax=Peromyscus maniculatus bairdii TaxID=230844 RepID=UPI003FD2BCF1